jgi:hypothetical protein
VTHTCIASRATDSWLTIGREEGDGTLPDVLGDVGLHDVLQNWTAERGVMRSAFDHHLLMCLSVWANTEFRRVDRRSARSRRCITADGSTGEP